MLDDQGRSIGTLALYFPEPRSPTTAERELIDFAAALGRMVLLRHQEAQDHRARDLEQAALETAERDRERTANDLHDGVCQQLAGIDYLLTAMIASAPPAQQRDLLEVRTLVEATLRDTSLMAAWLLPLSHHPEGLGAGLAELRRTVVATRTLQFDVDCDAELARELPPATAAALFALVQAASLHALTASTASQLLIRIERAAQGARACIEVDNTRFTDATADVELRALRYRARRVGARLMFEAVAAGHSRCSIGFA
jgi:signal transduction histidine kinase